MQTFLRLRIIHIIYQQILGMIFFAHCLFKNCVFTIRQINFFKFRLFLSILDISIFRTCNNSVVYIKPSVYFLIKIDDNIYDSFIKSSKSSTTTKLKI